ncbi:hypothetical protein contig5194.tmp0010 [Eimeria tenella]|uniref:Uncharacterized protein n=1 Tax=Eimeria tenella TaxID=5802 RepID=C8TE07_EIMTE|nr:hypothetical protein contig5194.tmp0010 [Eimeria tenella]
MEQQQFVLSLQLQQQQRRRELQQQRQLLQQQLQQPLLQLPCVRRRHRVWFLVVVASLSETPKP